MKRAVLSILMAVFLLPVRAFGIVETSVRVPMSDGVKLYADVVMPDASGGPWPVILARTPYTDLDAEQGMIRDALDMVVNLGFATLIQHTRGAGQSEGGGLPFFHDRTDGQDTLDWILDQPWSDGRVMTVGASALAIPAYLMASGADPGLVSQLNLIATPDVFDAVFQGGAFRKDDVESWTKWVGEAGSLDLMADHRDCDAFWDPVRIRDGGRDVRAAALHLGGWWDLFIEGNIAGFQAYSRSTDPWTSRHQYLIIGPWSHHGLGEARTGALTFPANSRYDLPTAVVAWLVWSFYGDSDVTSWPRVQYYTMGDVDDPAAPGNEWRGAEDWPPFPVTPTPMHLTSDGSLAAVAPLDADPVTIPFDPRNPSPTVGGRNLVRSVGPRDLVNVEKRGDAAVFTGDELVEPFEATGQVTARLWVATSGLDADVAVRLSDVYPDGRSMLVLDGIQRLSRRQGCAGAVPVTPGEFIEVEVDLGNVSYVFNAGHRIRAVVTGSNYPRFEVNPFLHEEPSPSDPTITLTIATGPERPSAVWLPVPAPEEPVPDEGVPEMAEVVEPVPDVIELDSGTDEGWPCDGMVHDDPGGTADAGGGDTGALADVDGGVDVGADPGQPARDAVEDVARLDAPMRDAAGSDVGLPPIRSGGGCAAAGAGVPATREALPLLLLMSLMGWGVARRRA